MEPHVLHQPRTFWPPQPHHFDLEQPHDAIASSLSPANGLRAAFILSDERSEMTCKARARAAHPALGRITFSPLLRLHVVGLDPAAAGIGTTLESNHNTRSQLQHVNAALSVDEQHCADAILDAVDAMEHCFPGSQTTFQFALRTALRFIRLHSTQGNPRQRANFEDAMRTYGWNGSARRATVSEPPFPVGTRRYWGLVLMPACADIEAILNRLGIP